MAASVDRNRCAVLAVNAKLKVLGGQKAALEDKLVATPDAEPLLHPALATIYRATVERLEASLRQSDTGREAFELFRGHCQTNLNGSAKGAGLRRSGRQLTPFSERGSTVLFEDVAAVEVAVLVEVVVD